MSSVEFQEERRQRTESAHLRLEGSHLLLRKSVCLGNHGDNVDDFAHALEELNINVAETGKDLGP